MIILSIVFTMQSIFILILGNIKCSNKPTIAPKFHLINKCHRSGIGIISYANYSSLKSCQRLGIERKGLALNFSPPEAWNNSQINYTCEILKCSELDDKATLKNDSRYDYYSLYGRSLPNINTTCVPLVGMFYLIKQTLNYTETRNICTNMTGILADVTNEQRTNTLAQLLTSAGTEAAFVGLRRINSSIFNTETGTTLECTTYRAWAPGHPYRYIDKFDCMVVTRSRTWQTTACSKRYPSLCELLPGRTFRKGSILHPEIISETTEVTFQHED